MTDTVYTADDIQSLADSFRFGRRRMVSTKDPLVVGVIRQLIEVEKRSATQVISLLNLPVKRTTIIGFCRNTGIRMLPQGFVPEGQRPATRKKINKIIKTVDDRRELGAKHPEMAVPEPKPIGKVMKRRLMEPRCCWAGCVAPPYAEGKAFCSVHNKGRSLLGGTE